MMNKLRPFLTFAFLLAVFLLLTSVSALRAQSTMKGPEASMQGSTGMEQLETSTLKLVLQGAIKLFQKHLSPIDGPRCDFHPTCSSFGLTAINRYGAVTGGMMTADRLIRCNPWKRSGDIYESLPDGKLIDHAGDNVLFK